MIQGYAIAALVSLATGFGGGYWLAHTKGKADRLDAAEALADAQQARMDATSRLMIAESLEAVANRQARQARQQEIRLTLKDRETRIEHIVAANPSPGHCVLPDPWLPILTEGHRAADSALGRLR